MKQSFVVTGLDIGSSKVSAVSAEIDKDGTFRILAAVTGASRGVSKAVIVDLDEAVDSVSRVMSKLEDKSSRKPGDIYVNISGEDIKGTASRGMVPLSLRGREVTRFDMARCVGVAGTIHLKFDREIVHRIVHNFSVDEQSWVKNPLGLYASRLNCEVYVITANANHIQNLYKCVNNTGYDIKELVFTGMADGASLLDPGQEEGGAILVDIGAAITEISIFCDGSLKDMDIITIGSADIKGDFKDDAQFCGLLARIGEKVQDFTAKGGRINSAVVTGGMAFTEGVVEFMEEKLGRPVKMGVAKDVRGDISGLDSVRIVTAIGLAKYAYRKHENRLAEEKDMVKGLSAKVVDIFNRYF